MIYCACIMHECELLPMEHENATERLCSSIEGIELTSFVAHTTCANADDSMARVYEEFKKTNYEYLAVLKEGAFLGLCSRRDLGFQLASKFGYAIHTRQPISQYLLPGHVTVRIGESIQAVLEAAWARSGKCFDDDIALLDAEGHFLGLIPTQTLARLQSQLLAEKIATLEARQVELDRRTEALEASEARMKLLMKRMPTGCVVWDLDFKAILWNPAAERIFGYKASEVLAQPAWQMLMRETERSQIGVEWEQLLQGAESVLNIYENRTKTGATIHCQWSSTLIRDEAGHSDCIMSLIEDITERKRAEEVRAKMEAQMLQTQKLESLGVLAGGIAHDFNNLLTTMLGNAELALMELPQSSPSCKYINDLKQASLRAADLCKQLLAYSGKGRFMVEPVNLTLLAQEMAQLFQSSISKKAVLTFYTDPHLPWVTADATQIRQVIMNLVVNASEAIGDAVGRIIVSTKAIYCDRQYFAHAKLSEIPPEGNYALLEVSDSGCGMDAATIKKIFDPFFTTKFTGRGLGLSAVSGIVRGHRGFLKVYSEPGRGTTFQVFLPVNESAQTKLEASGMPIDDQWGQGVLLLVDDEIQVREIGEKWLRKLGFDVLTADDGQHAVEVFRQNSETVKGVLLDLTMPRLDGIQALRELRRIKSDVPAILISGYSEHELAQRYTDDGLDGFVQKPYTMHELSTAIKRLTRTPART